MKRVGSYEAKTHLPRLLAEVEAGETVVITRHGVDIAKLVPANDAAREDALKAMEEIRQARRDAPAVTADEVLAWRDEGRE
ncbi:MAG: type II toxin-antitoxin system Phd/YefM family antitoxin [Sphingomonadales bacterium]